MRRKHVAPLPKQAIQILSELRKGHGAGELVFPGIGNKRRNGMGG
jgi:hypothetical protein